MGWTTLLSFQAFSGGSGGYKILSIHPHSVLRLVPPLILFGVTQRLMAYTAKHKDAVDGCYGRDSHNQSQPTLQSYLPEHEHANAPPPPHCFPAVRVLRCITFVSSLMIVFSRLHFLRMAPAMPPIGVRPRCTRAFKTSVMEGRCHTSTIWLTAMVF